MKTFLGAKGKPLDRKTAMGLAALNLLATPGLGTLMAGRVVGGLLQLAAAASGFLLLVKWFFSLFQTVVEGGGAAPAWEWQLGALLFMIGWLASLWSSLNIVRSVPEPTTLVPPKLDGSAG